MPIKLDDPNATVGGARNGVGCGVFRVFDNAMSGAN
eukprot:SAG31_NODE_35912_length_318_cov_0.940639_1_plen_35_part_10